MTTERPNFWILLLRTKVAPDDAPQSLNMSTRTRFLAPARTHTRPASHNKSDTTVRENSRHKELHRGCTRPRRERSRLGSLSTVLLLHTPRSHVTMATRFSLLRCVSFIHHLMSGSVVWIWISRGLLEKLDCFEFSMTHVVRGHRSPK